MVSSLKKIFWKCFTNIDCALKFPQLKNEEIGVQLGFDMTSAITSDLFTMHQRVQRKGYVIGIDPDPFNHKEAQKIIKKTPDMQRPGCGNSTDVQGRGWILGPPN